MTVLHETAAGSPSLLITTASELSSRSGGILRALGSGALVLVDDHRVGARAALMVPPQLIPAMLRGLGIDPGSVPDPGMSRDQIA